MSDEQADPLTYQELSRQPHIPSSFMQEMTGVSFTTLELQVGGVLRIAEALEALLKANKVGELLGSPLSRLMPEDIAAEAVRTTVQLSATHAPLFSKFIEQQKAWRARIVRQREGVGASGPDGRPVMFTLEVGNEWEIFELGVEWATFLGQEGGQGNG